MSALTRLSLANRLLVGLAAVAVVIFGVLAARSLRQELLPSTQVPTAVLTASYPGASPEIVAKEVAKPLSQGISGISGVTKVRATSTNGLASLTIEWNYGLDNDSQVTKIRTAADSAQLPAAVKYDVLAGSTDDIPVLVLGVASDAPLNQLAQKVADQLVPELSGIDGVRQVQVSGQDVTELMITLRPDRLRHYDLAAAQVTQALQSQATVLPAGNSYRGSTELAIQVGRTPVSAATVAGWYVPATDGPVRLSSIADVAVRSVDATSISRSDGRPALSVSILKESDADSVAVSHTVRDKLPAIASGIGDNASVQIVFDQAPSIEQSIHDLTIEGGLGLSFAVLIILVFLLSLRSTIITAISIPLSLLIALIGLQVADYSLNIFTLAAMTVAVGRVVDDSIVVVENIKRHDVGPGPLTIDSIITSVREVATAVTASTLTTIAVFLPVAIVSGITGELFRPFSTTVAIALAASLLVSMTIVPVLAYWFLNGRRRRAAAETQPAGAGAVAVGPVARRVRDEEAVTRMQRGYLPVLNLALRRPLISLLLALLIFAGTMASATLLKTNFLDSFADKTSLRITQKMPVGTRLTATSEAAKQVEAVLEADPGVKEYLTTIGQGGTNQASFFVSLVDKEAYATSFPSLQQKLAALTGAGEVKIGSINTGTDNNLSYTVTGDDEAALEQGAAQVEHVLKTTDGLTEVTTDLSDRRPQLDVVLDQRKAARLGFTQAEVGQAIANALAGTKIGTIELEGNARDIKVRTQDPASASPKRIGALELPVSQLQQQQASNAFSDKLQSRSDKLKSKSNRLSDDQQALADRQKAYSDAQQAKADKAVADQISTLRKQRRTAAAGVSKAKSQLRKVIANRPPDPDPSQPQIPVTVAMQRLEQWAAQVAQLQAAVSQAESGVKALDKQVNALVDQQRETAKQRATAKQFSDEQQALTDRQKALGNDQTDLADEQKKLADVRAKPIRVRDIAAVTQVQAPSTVTQIDGTRAITLTATPNTDDLGTLTKYVQSKIGALQLPAGVSIETGGASQDQADAFRQLGLAMLLAIVIVFMIMVATFRSLVQPLILLSSIPFAATGAVAGLLLTDTPLGVPAMVGLLMLIGIVVTNAIVLIDLINKERARGEDVAHAVRHGARLRLRPIIMTATATICALIPMGLGLTGGGAFISQPLAVVVIGGLVSSTVLTLLLVPVLYTLAEGRRERRRLRREQRQQAQAESDSSILPVTPA